uniref:Uncharacterized protein n=1 Tax=Cacopsylla melanoneura TaxID=428564 RepID=A0A8D8U8P6_9HEMI
MYHTPYRLWVKDVSRIRNLSNIGLECGMLHLIKDLNVCNIDMYQEVATLQEDKKTVSISSFTLLGYLIKNSYFRIISSWMSLSISTVVRSCLEEGPCFNLCHC